ncbi:DsbA family protein [Streptomonospora nanhaiensis]|uniref:Protein-disulfide isomerase n=1 Tax=Streptomonospora nanhaiensis TaxID=1323731 RepID=A0A853BJ81_9ACTN|nr:thioredoxin domain-containing protein [Streptomonospora nanhaiensis]MBV2362553.1 DsbA family protein [Streptomonospora nanhaiensis]MBX9391027.1 DsbA family protein [Streptomonospora nanhaiensis]NYI94785.1 protein-disulfide isomerase [Streptomonospora nanhaiensis]
MGKAAREASRERLRQERQKAEVRARRTKVLAVVGAALAVVLVVVGGGYLVLSHQRAEEQEFANRYESLPEQRVQQDGSVVVAEDGARAPVVEVYADYQCPHCKQFELTSGPTLQRLAAEGEAIVHYRPVSVFAQQPAPLGANSLRGAAAARAAADYGKFVQYNDLLFENQPAEGAEGYSAEQLKEWGAEAGIDDPAFAERVDAESEVVDTFTGGYLDDLVAAAEKELSAERIQEMGLSGLIDWGQENGVDGSFLEGTYVREAIDSTSAVEDRYASGANAFGGTPAVYVNGTLLGNEAYSGNGIQEAVEQAEPGEVDTEPLTAGGSAADASPQPDASP